MRGFGARDHLATVTSSAKTAPNMLRLHLHAPTLFTDAEAGPTAWLRFWFPDLDGSGAEYQRAYTIIDPDPESGTFAIDLVLHEPAGPATRWALAAEPGWTIEATSFGSSRFAVPEEPPAGYLLLGDSASVPAINGILAVLSEDIPAEVILEQHEDDDLAIPLTPHPRATVRWVPRGNGSALAAALPTRDWSDWAAWAACESGTLKHVRARLRGEFGFPKTEITAQAYWIFGRAMGKLRGETPPAEHLPAEAAQQPPVPEPAPLDPPTPVPVAQWRSQAGARLLSPLRSALIAAGVIQGAVTLLGIAPYVLLVELARRLLDGADAEALWPLGLWAIILIGASTLLGSALMLWLHTVDARFARGLRQRLLDQLSRLPLGWFQSRGSGTVKQLVQDDTLALHSLVTHAVPDAVAAVVAPVAVLGYLTWVDWRLALVLFLPVLVYVATMWVMILQSGKNTQRAAEWSERMNGEAAAYLDAQPVIRVFGGAPASGFWASLDAYVAFLHDWQHPFTGKKTLMDLATRPATFLWLIAGFGTLLVTTAGLDPLTLLPFLLLGTTFGAKLLGIGYGLSGIRGGLLAARRLQVVLDEPALGAPSGARPTAEEPADAVVFDRVGFAYRPGVPVLREVSLRLEPGTITALVGPSGSGKSTLAALLARFHEVGSGEIRLGGQPVSELTQDELYARVGFVLQDAQLVRGTVRENIALARPDADDAIVEAAARAAHIHERILRLPRGYQTQLGADSQLSGGERQRLTIARAILADTPVLVLDEATAFADPESEALVQRALSELTRGRTVLVIAHRLRTVAGVDQLVVLDRGEIVERGRHADLLAARGRYWQLWTAGEHPRSRTPPTQTAPREAHR